MLKRCKDEFKEFERQDVKHREDLKHVKQKIKKMDEKVEKVRYIYSIMRLNSLPLTFVFCFRIQQRLLTLQSSLKIQLI